MKKYKTLLFIGRFQPFHIGHQTVIDQALEQAELVIVGIGSANRSRDMYNPWYSEERQIPIMNHYWSYVSAGRLQFVHLDDFLYNDHLWEQNVQEQVGELCHRNGVNSNEIKLIGLEKDGTSYYLKKFPQWGHVPVRQQYDISATPIREGYFGSVELEDDLFEACLDTDLVPEATYEWLMEWRNQDEYHRMGIENQFNKQHQRPYLSLPHGHIDQTVDAVVIQSGHILMIERKAHPGQGLMALPGGYIKTYEDLMTACLRELTEEAGISFTEKPKKEMTERILRGSLVRSDRFADVHRSMRGRIITEAFYFNLEERERLPWVRPGSDAKKAFWVPLGELVPRHIFEDHYFIIQEMIRSKR